MRVTPLDIIKKEFTPSRKGVDEIEVTNFLEDIRETLDELLKENQRLRDVIKRRDAEIMELKGEESSIKDTLVLARRLTEDLERKSRRESDLIIGEARLEAQRILMESADERRDLQGDLTSLRSMKYKMMADMQSILDMHNLLLKDMQSSSSDDS
jgi:cell division initiation protein